MMAEEAQGFGYARSKPEGGTDADGRTSEGIGPGAPIFTPGGIELRSASQLRDRVAEAALSAISEFKVGCRNDDLTADTPGVKRATWDYLHALRLVE